MNILQHIPIIEAATPSGYCTQSDSFFGLVSWYHYLPRTANHCDIKSFNIFPSAGNPSDVPLIGVAILDDLLRIAAFVAVGFVLVGAVQYMTSQGNPEDTAKAQSSIINAIIGLLVTIVAATFVSFIGDKLGG